MNPMTLVVAHVDVNNSQLMNRYARLYDNLIDALQLINKCYSIQVRSHNNELKSILI